MGLASVPATFQRLMQATMSEFAFQFLLVYLDNLVYSKMFDEHMEHLERLLQRVRDRSETESQQVPVPEA